MSWKEWALYNPLYKAYLTAGGNPLTYKVSLYENSPVRCDVERNMLFEVGNPMYTEVNKTLRQRLPKGITTQIKLQVCSKQYKTVEYTCYCTSETWSYTIMNEILEGLNEQLIPPQDLTQGLIIKPSFVNKVE